jgi:hypothetical protein
MKAWKCFGRALVLHGAKGQWSKQGAIDDKTCLGYGNSIRHALILFDPIDSSLLYICTIIHSADKAIGRRRHSLLQH